MQWVLAVKTLSEFDQELTLFELHAGGWGPFIERVRTGTHDEIMELAQYIVRQLDRDVFVYSKKDAELVAEDSLEGLIRSNIFGYSTHLDSLH